MVSEPDMGPEGGEFEPWSVHPRCVVRQNKNKTSHSASLHPGVLMRTSKLLGDNLTKC